MSDWLIAIILGLVEGLTEFIPVSSTGHLLIAEHMLKVDGFFNTEVFNAVIQVGAVLAALPLFRDRLATLARWKEPRYRDYFIKLGAAFMVTAVGGLVMKKLGLRLPETVIPVAAALLVGGVLFIAVEKLIKGREAAVEISWSVALAIGTAQLVAVAFPGTSRSGATILVALLLGLGRGPATEFSFLLGVPTLCAAGALKLLESFKAHGAVLEHQVAGTVIKTIIPMQWGPLLLACVVAAISSVLAVKWMLGYVRTHTFTGFGWYRICFAAVLLLLHVG
jgi:undecaprenyl-diphosphatase